MIRTSCSVCLSALIFIDHIGAGADRQLNVGGKIEESIMFGQGQHSTRTVSIDKRSVTFDFLLPLLFFFVATETNSVSKGLCKFTFRFHQYDDGFILFMYHTVTHGQSTIAEQVSIFRFFVLTFPSNSVLQPRVSSLQRWRGRARQTVNDRCMCICIHCEGITIIWRRRGGVTLIYLSAERYTRRTSLFTYVPFAALHSPKKNQN